MKPKKHLGQNFLIDKNKINLIIDTLDIKENSYVLEVGPGTGALTKPISEKTNNFLVIEIDNELIPELQTYVPNVVNADILDIDLYEYVKHETIFVSNLPYYISTKILFKVMENEKFKFINVMMQKELIDRIYANTSTKEFGRLSVAVRTFYDVKKIIDVPRGCFKPKPNVDSGFISLQRNEIKIENRIEYLKFIKNAFAQKRKKFLNSLKNNNSIYYESAKKWLSENNITENVRAEEISIEDYIKMWNSFNH